MPSVVPHPLVHRGQWLLPGGLQASASASVSMPPRPRALIAGFHAARRWSPARHAGSTRRARRLLLRPLLSRSRSTGRPAHNRTTTRSHTRSRPPPAATHSQGRQRCQGRRLPTTITRLRPPWPDMWCRRSSTRCPQSLAASTRPSTACCPADAPAVARAAHRHRRQ
ncbi:hypothetical protein BC831DRAFT_463550 [Entophlyctis helioformis]|nr:hypothetical protein BC831DRAFT_463550 [Entophlyctis helioformis]